MKKYEAIIVILYDRTEDENDRTIRGYYSNGWRLVSTYVTKNGDIRAIFEREITEGK